jgi:parallel beta-helix repeat protein
MNIIKISRRMRLSVVLSVVVGLMAPAAQATSGVILVLRNTTVTLSEDHYGSIIVRGGGRLDCAYHAIYNDTQPATCGADGGNKCGVVLTETNAEVRNCEIEDFDYGVYAGNATGPLINGVTTAHNDEGIRLENVVGSSSDERAILHGQSSSNEDEGLNANVLERMWIRYGNYSGNGSEGIKLEDSFGVLVGSTSVWGNDGDGIDMSGSGGSHWIGNCNIDDNDGKGVHLKDATDSVIDENVIANNEGDYDLKIERTSFARVKVIITENHINGSQGHYPIWDNGGNTTYKDNVITW